MPAGKLQLPSQLLQQQFNCVGKADLGSVALPAIMRTGAGGPENLQVGTMPQAQLQITSGQMHRGHMPPLTSAQQALTGTINSSMQAVNAAQATLDDFETLPPFGQNAVSKAWCKNKMDESKHEIHSQVDAITAGTASVVNLTSGDPADTDYTAVGCAVTTISSNLTEMSKGVKLLAALMEDEGGNGWQLLQAAKNLASAISDLLKTAQPASAELHQNLLQAAGLVGQTSGELLQQIGETNAAAALVLKAKNVAQKTEDSVLQAQVILAATQCALSTSQLVACTKVVAPTISSPVCQEQLIEAGKLVAKSAESCVEASKATTSDDQLLKQVGVATTTVNQALNDLLQHIKQHATGGQPIGCYDQATDTILSVTENIWVMQVRVREMVRQAHILAQATSNLVNAIKADAEGETDLENSRKLLSAAKILADATAKMVEAAKIRAAAHPDSEEQQQWLQEAAEGLRMATNAVAQNAIKNKLVHKLEHVAKQAATSATQTIAAAQHAAASNKNPVVQQQLVQSCKVVADQIPMLVQGVRGSQLQLDSPSAQLALIAASQNFLQVPPNLLLAGETGTLGGKGRNHICGRIKLPVQDPETDRTVSMSSSKLLLAAKALSADPTAPNLKNQLAAAARAVTDSINQLITMCIQQASGQKECDNALRELEAVKELLENPIQAVNDMSYFNCLDSVMENSKVSVFLWIRCLAGGQAAQTQEALEEAVQMMKEAAEDLTTTLNEAASAAGVVGGMVDSITQAINQLDEGPVGEPEGTFVDYQITMVKMAKAIAVTVQEMVTKSTTNPDELGILANQLTNDYGQLVQEAKPVALTAETEEIGSHIKCRVQELGHGCTTLVTKAGALQCSPSDAYTKKELIESACKVSKKVSHVLAALQAGNRGTQACITAASAVSGIIADLDTTIMFATAGILNQENSETFADHREGILKTARALVEDTKVLVQNAMANQEKLAQAAQSSVTTITHLAEVVKLGAAILGSEDPETQLGWGVVLISAVKDVAKALGDLISATKAAAGKAGDDPTVYQLKNSAKVMVTNVTSLLKTVKTVEDEATKGMRALEATIEHIHQELVVFSSPVPPAQVSTPEDFIRMTKGITMATDKAVAAGNSCRQEDVIAMANLSRCAIADMLHACKEAAYHPEVSADVRQWALRFDRECAGGYLELLEHVLVILQKPTHELKQQLAGYSKRVASSVTELIQAAEAMKGMEWVDPEDPKVIAENELLGAAAAIEAVSKKLEQLKPRAKPKQADESLDFEKQILEAAKSIVAAMSALVKAASAAQRELVAQGKVGAIPANAVDDGQWSQGLISAACMVAAATNNLCEAANVAVQGHASEEKLILSDKQVAASTAQLLVACKVKADHDSDAMMRLQVSPSDAGSKPSSGISAAGNAVKRASDNLVKAAQKAAAFQDHDETVVVKEKMVGGIAQQIIATQEEMLHKEWELEEACKKLAMIRQQQYKFLPSELQEEEQN
uniref:I/LWEQ domain-containing protein n=2 Tax=Anas TaxID=8835 RepID=A0A8B9ZI81_ANAPL